MLVTSEKTCNFIESDINKIIITNRGVIMGIFEEIGKSIKQINELDEKINSLEEEKNNKINLIIKKHVLQIKEIEDQKHENENIIVAKKQVISDNSNFDCDLIGNVISKLISIIEKEPYKYYNAKYYINGVEYDPMYSGSYDLNTVYLINKEKKVSTVYEDNRQDRMKLIPFYEKDDDIILLFRSKDKRYYHDEEKTEIKFYDADQTNVDVKRFSYVIDFINYVIEYRIENNVNDITSEELEKLVDEFIDRYIKEKGESKKLINKKI